MKSNFSRLLSVILVVSTLVGLFILTGYSSTNDSKSNAARIVKNMTLDEKISQMIIPAFRTWNEENVTDLSSFPEIGEALRRHQYCGACLFGSNIS